MTSRCISCKREIAKSQKDCYICGSQQNYFIYYLKPLFSIFILLLVVAWFANGELDKRILDFQANQENEKLQNAIQVGKDEERLNDNVNLLKVENEALKDKINLQNLEIAKGSSNSSDNQKLLDKEKGRTNWLRKENSRFAVKIKSLTEHIANLEKQLLVDSNAVLSPVKKESAPEGSIDDKSVSPPILNNPESQSLEDSDTTL